MSTTAAVPDRTAKSHRVLACILCQQRKIKCDRRFPCVNCGKAGAQCVPATLNPRQRRRRFPERELLDRLRRYEGLLRKNNIEFEPLHTPDAGKPSPDDDDVDEGSPDIPQDEPSRNRATRPFLLSTNQDPSGSETVFEAKNFWHAMNQRSQDSAEDDDSGDDSNPEQNGLRQAKVQKLLDRVFESNDHILFGSPGTDVQLSTLHPQPGQIFKLWQIYLENVDPLLKVTHAPTLQPRVINAAGDVTNISPALEALMFSIYCMALLSLTDSECMTSFASPKSALMATYQYGCQQALLKSTFLRSGERDCLTALFLFLISVRQETDPRSLSSMLGLAFRIAERMGIHNESANVRCTVLEAEMRRRLWWSLILFDTRICEMSSLNSTMLGPTWDCKIPLNVNDFELRPEMKTAPTVQGQSTEAVFAVVRSELGDFVRHSNFHLDFTSPALKALVKNARRDANTVGGELDNIEKMVEDKYFKYCNPDNPLHFMTIWTARGYLAKARLLECYSRSMGSTDQQTEARGDIAATHALNMLECDTKLLSSPLIKRYQWMVDFYFPFPAYVHVVQNLKKRSVGEHAEKAWKIMDDNYAARFLTMEQHPDTFFKLFARVVLQAWDACEATFGQSNKTAEPPTIVLNVRNRLSRMDVNAQDSNTELPKDIASMNIDDYMSVPMDFGHDLTTYAMEGQGFPDTTGPATMGFDANQWNWNTADWNTSHGTGW